MTALRPSLRRRLWIVGACTVLALVAALAVAATRHSGYYRAQAVLEVPANGGAGDTTRTAPGAVATTYLDVILNDAAIADRLAAATGLPRAVARGRLTAVRDANTSVIRLSYVGPTAAAASRGRDVVVAAVVGSHPATAAIPAGGVMLVDDTAAAQHVGRDIPGGPIPIGIILGLIVGVAALIAWDRWDPRVDTPGRLQAVLGVPVTGVDAETPDSTLETIVTRWAQLRDPGTTGPIVVAPVDGDAAGAATEMVARLSELGHAGARPVLTQPVGAAVTDGVELMRAGVVVLVERSGGSLRADAAALEALRALGVTPGWAMLAVTG